MRKVKIYRNFHVGWGCVCEELTVTDANFVSETEDTITLISEELDHNDDLKEVPREYIKSLPLFEKRVKAWYTDRHEQLEEEQQRTQKMIDELKLST